MWSARQVLFCRFTGGADWCGLLPRDRHQALNEELFSWWLCCRQLREGALPPLRRSRCPRPRCPGRVASSSPASAPPVLQQACLGALSKPAAALGHFLSTRRASHLKHLLYSWAWSVFSTSEGCSAWLGSAWTSQGLNEPQKQSAMKWRTGVGR